jgi:thymidylate synthase (FAD)
MKIVEPSFEILDQLDSSSVAVRLEQCARVCYKSEDKITEQSATPFVTRIAAHGHNSVLEMAVVTFQVICHPDHVLELLSCQPRYLEVSRIDNGMIVTGSIRTFRELYINHPYNQLVSDLVTSLQAKEPLLFENIFDGQKALDTDSQLSVKKMSLAEVEQLPDELKLRHRYLGVKFVVNRAVSHELVRHRPCSFLQESQRYCRYSDNRFDNQVTFVKPMFFDRESEEYTLWQQAMAATEVCYLKLLETSTPQSARTVLPNSCKTEIVVYCNLLEWAHIFSLRTSKAADPSMREIMIPLQQELRKRYPAL